MTVMTAEPISSSVQIGSSEIVFETGRLAKQASGAVWVRSGGTAVLATATGAAKAREGTDFFPLTVDVEEKMYAAGKIPGGFFKREGRSGEKAILTARMIDRPIRPLWPKGYRADVHCIATVMSTDMENAHDILSINGVSAALMVSPLPFFGPVGAVRVGLIDGELAVNPTMAAMLESSLDLVVCGTEQAITMVEAGADVVPEDMLVEALELAHAAIKQICAAQRELADKAGKPKWTSAELIEEMRGRYFTRIEEAVRDSGLAAAAEFVNTTLVGDAAPAITMDSTEEDIEQRVRATMTLGILLAEAQLGAAKAAVAAQFGDRILAFSNAEQDSKELKSAKKDLLVSEILANIKLPFPAGDGDAMDDVTRGMVKAGFDAAYKATVRHKIAVDKRRPDGRGERDLRDIWCAVGEAPRTHGSGLFQRGQTQVLSLCTLGTTKEEQRIDDLTLETNKYYIHHYNFPPFSVGETGFMRGPKRRDIGHGALAERALAPMIPPLDEFPYTIRVVSETLESNGSSSMASVCGSTLSMMDAGVPIASPVAGIAMGLIMEGDEYVILTDIQGAEDHLGDMDFKVAGTSDGVTALQMDIKITGVTTELLRKALDQAKEARLAILDIMAGVIAEPRAEVSEHAPSFRIVKIDPDQIGMVIGKGGETIRGLEEEYTVSIGIQEDGTVQIYGVNKQSAVDAAEAIESMCKEIEVGDEFDGTVVSIKDFGAFVELKKGTDGLLHISAMGAERVERVEDVLERGDVIGVRVQEIDASRGRISLVMIRDKNGNAVEPRAPRTGGDGGDRPRGGQGGRGGDRNRGGGDRNRGGGDRNRGGGDRNRGGGDRNRSGGGRPRQGDGGQRSGGDRDRNRSEGGRGQGGQRQGGDRDRTRGDRDQNRGQQRDRQQDAAPAPEQSGEERSGRRFKFRLRGGDED